ncbi:conserved exported hypothetical protein [Xenorhabdus bovienii str. kraussei Quebec]|uniref:Type IV secretion system putative lipoprotein virB7 n=1 Tax=Xenorhabdus bovienii str. kraussei Quebec TaxID=1398203 RepID=A0A077PNM5_XENBV|nr:lipoprotein [Xenorhabdus bovienii]CDH22092.1 conserved exported hypothetical protein [Xenorhabdus bovienii str. kraussei Quebec]
MRKIIIGLLAVVVLSGCTNQEALKKKTQSGKPEGVYENTTKAAVRDALTSYCNERGFMVVEATESTVLCSKETEGMGAVMAQMAIGNTYSTTPVGKLRFSIGEVNEKVKVWADTWMETQMAMGQINQMKINDNASINALQDRLDNLNPKTIL